MAIKKIITIIVVMVVCSMIKFNTSNLNDNTYSTYEIDEFNGVDYTTTPTKVAENNAVAISNYLPEGKSLVKRYGYSIDYDIEQSLGLDNYYLQDIDAEYARLYEIYERDWVSYNIKIEQINFSNISIIVVSTHDDINGRSIDVKTLGIFVKENGIVFSIRERDNFDYYDQLFNDTMLEYQCLDLTKKCFGFELNNKIYFFAFGNYYCYYKEGNVAHCDLVVDIAYVPTFALNVQPTSSTNRTVQYEQLNMLSNKFKASMYYYATVKFDGNGDATFIASLNDETTTQDATQSYDMATLLGRNDISVNVSDNYAIGTTFNLIDASGSGDTLPVELTAYSITNGVLSITMDFDTDNLTAKNANSTKVYYIELPFTFKMNSFNIRTLFNCQCGTLFGSYNSKDRLFLAVGNVDYHSLDNKDGIPDYTYFGTETYCAVGESNSKIIGYGLQNDGNLAIFKDSNALTNVYIREARINNTTETYEVYDYALQKTTTYSYTKSVEIFPTFATGLLINSINENTKLVQYDNKLIFNTTDGIYYLSLDLSTANQTYSARELSYNIRSDLGSDIENSSMVVYDNKLYVARKNKEGQLRVYVADKNRYTFINSEAQYHWWVLDNIPAYEMFVQNNELYFKNGNLVYKYIENQMYDYDEKYTNSATVGGTTFDTEIMFNTNNETMIISPTSDTWKNLTEIWKYNAALDKKDKGVIYKYLKDYITIRLDNNTVMRVLDNWDDPAIIDTDTAGVIAVEFDANDTAKLDFYNYLVENNCLMGINFEGYNYYGTFVGIDDWSANTDYYIENDATVRNIKTIFDEGRNVACTGNKVLVYLLWNIDSYQPEDDESQTFTFTNKFLIALGNMDLKIKEMQTLAGDKLSECVFDYNEGANGTWKDINTGDVIGAGDTTNFNIISFEFMGVDINFYNDNDNNVMVNDMPTLFKIKMPIKSMWCSGFNDLGRIDVLKTTRKIHFVPETRRGGYTHVGYSSNLKQRDYDIALATKNLYYSLYRGFTSNDFGLDFNDIEFDDFSFEGNYFARTYSASKKIKNFSYLQLRLYSDDFRDSTISNIAIKYFYGKNSRGVK